MHPRGPLVIRVCAAFDLAVTGLLALPATATPFVRLLYALGGEPGLLGGEPGLLGAEPEFGPLRGPGLFFANLAGMLGVLWALVRLLRPEAWLARADAAGRCAVAALIAWHLAHGALPAVLWLFVATEALGALAQAHVTRRRGSA